MLLICIWVSSAGSGIKGEFTRTYNKIKGKEKGKHVQILECIANQYIQMQDTSISTNRNKQVKNIKRN
jgi:hypothetical protein